jgi:hypothetical protein
MNIFRRPYKNATISLGKCYFAGQGNHRKGQDARMYQYIHLFVELMDAVRTGAITSWLGARCGAIDTGYITVRLEQYNSTNHLIDYSIECKYQLSTP